MRRDTFDAESIRRWFVVDRIPLTKILLVSNALTFILIALFFKNNQIERLLAFNYTQVRDVSVLLLKPWTLFTYAFVTQPDVSYFLIFTLLWLWIAAGSLERSWGTHKFAWYFFSMTAVSALGVFVGGLVSGTMIGLIGLWLPLSGLTVAFAMKNPEQQILFMFIFPLKLKYLALIDIIFVLVILGRMDLLLGLFGLVGCAYSYWYIQPNRFSMDMPQRKSNVTRVYDKPSLNPFKKMKEARERERLRKLFENSYGDEDDRDRR